MIFIEPLPYEVMVHKYIMKMGHKKTNNLVTVTSARK